MYIRDLKKLLEKMVFEGWWVPSKFELSRPLSEQIIDNSKTYLEVGDKPETDDEIFAEYLCSYLLNLRGTVNAKDGCRILKDIFWIFSKFRSTYILSMTDNSFTDALTVRAVPIVLAEAEELLIRLDKEDARSWNSIVINLRNKLREG